MLLMDRDHFSKFYNEGVVVVIQQPAKRVVHIEACGNLADELWDGHSEENRYNSPRFNYNDNFYLSFPYSVFRIKYIKYKGKFSPDTMSVAFATSFQPKEVYVPPLFNIDESLQVCISLRGKFSTLSEMYKYCIATFWKTEFNDGMFDAFSDNYGGAPRAILFDPRKWEKKTRENPNWIPTARSLAYYGRYRDFCEEIDPPEREEEY